MTESMIPVAWVVGIFSALGTAGLLLFRWWVGTMQDQNAALAADLRRALDLIAEMRAEQRVQAERITMLVDEVERLRGRAA